MSIMGEPSYHHPPGRNQLYPQDWTTSTNWTPHSAVSSFNFPQQVDSTLITPVSTMSPPTRAAPIKRELQSPTTANSNFHFFPNDDYSSGRPKSPMKYRNPSAPLPISTQDSFPLSPLECPSPFWGPYGVSAPPSNLTSTPNSSSNMNASPLISSNNNIHPTSRYQQEQRSGQSASTYGPSNQAPILIAPNPKTLRPSSRQFNGPDRQNSLDSGMSTPRSGQVFQGPGQSPFLMDQEVMGPLPRRRKRKSPSHTGDEEESTDVGNDKSRQEALLVQLRITEGRQWKEVMELFNEATGLSMKVPALEMRLKRFKERTRPWTEADENALAMSHAHWTKNKWSKIAEGMLQHGVSESWTKAAVKRKWEESHPEDNSPRIYLDPRQKKRTSNQGRDASDWSEGEDNRNRLATDHTSNFQRPQQQQQHQIIFDQGQQQ